MAPPPGKRNKILHRFYEPLVLLYVLDQVQGDHLYPDTDRLPVNDLNRKELRRRFLNSLSYICDHEKGGDTMTAISVADGPLTYYIACNKTPKLRVKQFLKSILSRLGLMYGQQPGIQDEVETSILTACVAFSEKRIKTYWKFLQGGLEKSIASCQDEAVAEKLRQLSEELTDLDQEPVALCRHCHSLMKAPKFEFIKERARTSEGHNNNQHPFSEVKHFVGRLAFHVKAVGDLRAAANRLPQLFLEPKVKMVPCPALIPRPGIRSKTTLDGIADRMISNDPDLFSEIQTRLQTLDQQSDVEAIVQKEYDSKNWKPRVHAELILLEYFYCNRETLQYLDNDPYIGCSKPACYCCSLYIREHPARFEAPASHQKIYLNWMPPTSVDGVQEPNSILARHEQSMLDKMVQSIRKRTIEQIRTQSGRRQKHFDSVTGNTYSTTTLEAFRARQRISRPSIQQGLIGITVDEHSHMERLSPVTESFTHSTSLEDSGDDSDHDGGVGLGLAGQELH